jgi:PKD repeat protein
MLTNSTMKIYVSLLAICFTMLLQGQDLLLKSGKFDVELLKSASYSSDELQYGNNMFYKIVFFDQLPDDSLRSALVNEGIRLLDYLPKNCFFAEIASESTELDLSVYGISKVVDVQPEFKLSEMLFRNEFPHWALFGENQIELNGLYFSGLDPQIVLRSLASLQLTVLEMNTELNSIMLRVNSSQLNNLYAHPLFQYFETVNPPGEPENLPGRTSHRSNSLWTNYDNGLKYRGEGVKVMMQDDGFIGPHIDYQGRADQSACSPCSAADENSHGDHVGGTIMGAGNLDPRSRGMAHGAELLVYNSSNANYNFMPTLYQNEQVYITSKSYSDACNGGYTTLTRQLDQQVRLYPSLMHVFSAGNSGSDDCGYGAGSGWGNITGGHKSGKNLLAVGNLFSTSLLNSSSSRGPATDGRIKPDICGVGTSVNSTISPYTYASFTGTSMSCPGVSGTIAQLYEAYRDLNAGENPDAGLIKAVVLNTADDLGNPGPDYRFGWGSLNARKAYNVLAGQNYTTGMIAQEEQMVHTITVPAGLTKLNVMVYWTDYEGTSNASIALVNDINIEVRDPSNIVFQPWILDPTADPTILNTPAGRGIDNLNNVEQVSVSAPEAGTYEIVVHGFSIPQGPQNYVLVYYFEEDEIVVTYPAGGENLTPSSNELIRWDAPEGTESFTVSYSNDNGNNWLVLGNVNAAARHLSWSIPASTLTAQGKIKVERGSVFGVSESAFSVIGTPSNLAVLWSCPDSLKLVWRPVNGALEYEVSRLGDRYMDSIAVVSDTSLTLMIAANQENWFSVKSRGLNGEIGERALAIRKLPGEFGCVWSAPYADFEIDCEAAGQAYCFTLEDASLNTDGATAVTWYFPGGSPAVANGIAPQVCYAEPGFYDVAMVVDNGFGVDSVYRTAYIEVLETPTIPYLEGFEGFSSFAESPYWTVNNISGSSMFHISSQAALTGENSAMLQNFGQPVGSIDELVSGPIDLSSLLSTEAISLSFRYAYRKRTSANVEVLKVFIRKDCKDTWLQRKTLSGNALSSLTNTTFWTPSGDQDWVTVHMTNVTSQFFTGDFRMKFVFESDGGNNLFLDNINIYTGSPSEDLIASVEEIAREDLVIFPNPTDGQLNVQFDRSVSGEMELRITDLTGKQLLITKVMAQTGTNLVIVATENLSAGMYLLNVSEGISKKTYHFMVK